MKLAPGTLFAGDYRVVRPLQTGGMGALFVVDQLSTGKQRALKLMHRELVGDPSSRQRFEQEARVGSRIASEHVVEVQAAGVDAQTQLPYLVMELLEGEDLASRLKRGAVPIAEAAPIFEQIAHALGAAHDAGVVHRDLKPDNVFLAVSRRSGTSRVVKILDFGIAKVVDDNRRTTGAFGTPLWLSPEQTRVGHVSPAADVWAFALVVFATLTGHVFWRAGEQAGASLPQLLHEILNAPISPASSRAAEYALSLPLGIDAWFRTALMRDPGARFPNVRIAYAALAPLLAAPPAMIAPQASFAPPPQKSSAGMVIAIVLGVLLVLAIVVGVGAVFAVRSMQPVAATTATVTARATTPTEATTTTATEAPTILATAPPPAETHVGAFVWSGDADLQTDAVKQVNETLAEKFDGCLASHPNHAPKANVTVMAHVAADGTVATVNSITQTPHPTVQCMVEIVKATKFVSRKKPSDLMVTLTWK